MKYLVAVDGSAYAEEGLEMALKLARRDTDQVVILLVQGDFVDASVLAFESIQQMGTTLKVAEEQVEKRALHLLSTYKAKCEEKGVNARTILEKGGAVPDVILEVTTKEQADMLIVGSRGLGTLARLLLGSVSEYLVRNAPCPVLVVRRIPEELQAILEEDEKERAREEGSVKHLPS